MAAAATRRLLDHLDAVVVLVIVASIIAIVTTAAAAAYRDRILAALPVDMQFEPLMTLYLTNNTTSDEIRRAAESDFIHAVKLYPAGATTNSDAGVTDLINCYPVLETMQEVGLPFLVHGEVTDPDVDLFDREAVFIERIMRPLRKDFPALPIVFEHITTKDAAQYVAEAEGPIGAIACRLEIAPKSRKPVKTLTVSPRKAKVEKKAVSKRAAVLEF